MRKHFSGDERGVGHFVLVVLIVAVLGVVGFAGWKVMSGDEGGDLATNAAARAVAEASCEGQDENICKFMASWKDQPYYTLKSTDTTDGQTTTSTYRSEGKTKYHMTTAGEVPYEFITIDKTMYTKAPDGTWWKQTFKQEDAEKYTAGVDTDFAEEDPATEETGVDKTTYKSLGTEACGELTCHKYQVVDPSAPDDKEFIWFDTKDYQLRHMRSERADGSVSDQLFSYDKVSIKVPSAVKELGPNQMLVPGQNEPMTLPSAEDMQQYTDGAPEAM